MNSLREAYVAGLKELYDVEQQITQMLPTMAQQASHPDLKRAIEEHVRQTEGQIHRLDQIFQRMGETPGGVPCPSLRALFEEAQQKLQQSKDPDTRDALLIAAQQKVEHLEIAGYGTARSWALHLNEADAAELLQQTADEEGETDKRLTRLAETMINREAMEDPMAAAA